MPGGRGTFVFWADLMSDPALALCSLAAQGLWFRMLGLCGLSDRPGYLEISKLPVSSDDLIRLIGHPADEILPLLSELEGRKVFSRDRRGCIYNRRMVRDEIKASKNRDNGKLGGNPSLRKQTTKSRVVNPMDKANLTFPCLSKSPVSNTETLPAASSSSIAAREETKNPAAAEPPPAAAQPAPQVFGSNLRPATTFPADAVDRVLAIWDSPNLLTTSGRLQAWERSGADFEQDVMGALLDVTSRQRKQNPEWAPRSLKYFDQAVADRLRTRTDPQPRGSPNGKRARAGNGYSQLILEAGRRRQN